MFNKDYSPYDELQELRKFALGADQHIGNLLKNEKEMIKAVNAVHERLERMERRLALMEKVLEELAKAK
ncbi:MAG: hypothetical protein Unbinned3585contig1000_7 [Prokaryotic dsDNA virus sp.]|jgi:lipopolysaccharide biosynthesis regulator YciM|nr:MAG: hypothetical protein Unbinned3585contig1000_7 [Prokaryotic dsDNA virus sp.]|tara:strand:+ start:534 stop:740 length:207 start_codon:yes stop_codon:yes gene_type:complete